MNLDPHGDPQQQPRDAGQPLTQDERTAVARYFSEPQSFPEQFQQWILQLVNSREKNAEVPATTVISGGAIHLAAIDFELTTFAAGDSLSLKGEDGSFFSTSADFFTQDTYDGSTHYKAIQIEQEGIYEARLRALVGVNFVSAPVALASEFMSATPLVYQGGSASELSFLISGEVFVLGQQPPGHSAPNWLIENTALIYYIPGDPLDPKLSITAGVANYSALGNSSTDNATTTLVVKRLCTTVGTTPP